MKTVIQFSGSATMVVDGEDIEIHQIANKLPIKVEELVPESTKHPGPPVKPPMQPNEETATPLEAPPTPSILPPDEKLDLDTVGGITEWYLCHNRPFSKDEYDIIVSWIKDLLRIVAQQGNNWSLLTIPQRMTMIRNHIGDGLKCGQIANWV